MSNLHKNMSSCLSEKTEIIAGSREDQQWWPQLKKMTDWRVLRASLASVSPGFSVKPSRHRWRWLKLRVRWVLFTVRGVSRKVFSSFTRMRDFEGFGKETSPLACGCSLTPQFIWQHTKSKYSWIEMVSYRLKAFIMGVFLQCFAQCLCYLCC